MYDYYDWNKTMSYDADVTMVVGARGIGKTFGLRLWLIQRYLKRGIRYAECVRYASDVPDFSASYALRISEHGFFDRYVFKSNAQGLYIAPRPDDGSKVKASEWQQVAYFIPMTGAQKAKTRSFSNVRYVVLDEAIIDKDLNPYERYLPNEWEILANIVDTVTRERPGDLEKPHVFLLGNAVDLTNPYFIAAQIYDAPKPGFTWHNGNTFLLHYHNDAAYSAAKARDTVAGRMLSGTDAGIANASNVFNESNNAFLQKQKPKNARYCFGITYKSDSVAVWDCAANGYYYIDSDIRQGALIFSLSTDGNKPNYIYAKRMNKALRGITDMYTFGCVRFSNAMVKEIFERILSLFGVR